MVINIKVIWLKEYFLIFLKLIFYKLRSGEGSYTYKDGSNSIAKVTGDRDPGYGSTSKMLSESAICLAMDKLDSLDGVITPSTAMGDNLLERLKNKSGLTFNIKHL